MHRNTLTERYLDEAACRGFGHDQLARASRLEFDLDNTTYHGKVLPRPAFLTGPERARLQEDLHRLIDALGSLPDRLYGGDFAAFAAATGMTDGQVAACGRDRSTELTRLTRADIYHDGTDFRLMEVNFGSTIGGLDHGMLNQAAMTLPFVAEFVEANRLSYVDGLAELAAMFWAEAGTGARERLLVAVIALPENLRRYESVLRTSGAALARHGVDFELADFTRLSYQHGRVWLDGRPVDLVYRVLLVEDLLQPEVPAMVEPLMSAVERGEVRMFTPMDTDAYASKAALAMLSDEANRHLLDTAQLSSLDRLLPWTRMVRDEQVTVDGERVELLHFAERNREELVLKPTLMHGGSGVTLGWLRHPAEWTRLLHAAVNGPYVLQRRIRPAPELVPTTAGMVPMLFIWGVFTMPNGYGGAYVRGTATLDGSVLNRAAGADMGCCFHEFA